MEKENGKNPKESPALVLFLFLIVFFSLGFLSFGVGSILFQLINKYVPDPFISGGFLDQGAVRFGIASLLVAGPIFFGVSRLIDRYLREEKINDDSMIRKGLTYVVLFIAAATIIGDLVGLVFNFLEGELVARFALKSVVVLLISGAIFGYYFWDMRKAKDSKSRTKINKNMGWGTVLAVTAIFLASLFLIDSPQVARSKRIDRQTIGALQELSSLVQQHYDRKKTLPEDTGALMKEFPFQLQGDIAVTYRKTGETTFEVCGDFRLPSPVEDRDRNFGGLIVDEWRHGAGEECFQREVFTDRRGELEKPLSIPAVPTL